MEVDMVDLLVRNATVVLEDIVVLGPDSKRNLLCYWQNLGQRLIWDIVELLAVVLWDDEGVAAGQWLDVEEGVDVWRVVELEGRDVTYSVLV